MARGINKTNEFNFTPILQCKLIFTNTRYEDAALLLYISAKCETHAGGAMERSCYSLLCAPERQLGTVLGRRNAAQILESCFCDGHLGSV